MTTSFEELFKKEQDKLTQCVHCGLCLDECPTYVLHGDENNSPRGRLFQWRALAEGSLQPSKLGDDYTDACVGCLACQSACPANVPYGELLASARAEQAKRRKPDWRLRLAGSLVKRPKLFNLLTLPARLARQAGLAPHRLLPPGEPEALLSTQAYAEKIQVQWQNTGPLVDLHTGCLMEGVYRDLNFATVRVLAANGFRVRVPGGQVCCGSLHEHEGLEGKAELDPQNRAAFAESGYIVSNSSGCGLSLTQSLGMPVLDVGRLLNDFKGLKRGKAETGTTIFYDQPCHLIHGQRVTGLPNRVFQALGAPWQLAPDSDRCCGAGGAHNLTHPEDSKAILKEKAAFLWKAAEKGPVTLIVNNHICQGQWESGKADGTVPHNVKVQHLVTALDQAYKRAKLY